jgi:hypothetical protein
VPNDPLFYRPLWRALNKFIFYSISLDAQKENGDSVAEWGFGDGGMKTGLGGFQNQTFSKKASLQFSKFIPQKQFIRSYSQISPYPLLA